MSDTEKYISGEALRAARLRKGWSQRDLAEKSGMVQAHISRIEAGAVDPRVSTFLELARLLDLEAILVPSTAISAVSGLIRETMANREAGSIRGMLVSLQKFARRLRTALPGIIQAERLLDLSAELIKLEAQIQGPGNAARLTAAVDRVSAASRNREVDLRALDDGVSQLAQLRNELAHARPDGERPAYRLDEDD